ncbi:Transmembrane protein -like protein [Toxocara canis]|uniref:Transmembrane protein-like protein n=1 Tax=Toxocara canis TaxID=6265 RepID=A0A0B2V833_TOXCA|nr:Transmembrane protein -like protein [Toxocara canis]
MAQTRDAHIESHTQRPTRRTILGAIRYEFYWKCLLSTLLVHLCVCYAVWCHLNHYAYASQISFTYSHGPCAQGYNFIPIAFGIMLYIVYIMECWHNRVKIAKIKKVHHIEALEYIEKMRAAVPIVWWKSICYHYVRRTRQVTRYRNGDAITATQAYYERVNSHSAGNVFMYDVCGVKDISKSLVDLDRFPVTKIRFSKGFVFACMQAANEFEEQRSRFFNENEIRDDYMEDISKSLVDLDRFPVTKIRFSKGFVFACMQAANEFEEQRSRFFNENEIRDDYMEVREGLDFADIQFIEQMITFSSPSHKCPWYLSATAFWIFSILLLSWPLRLLCELRTAHVSYQITKLFGTNYLSPSSINYTGPLTRTSTMDSRELELAAQRDSYLIVPSYSEAMLLEPSSANNQIYLPSGHFRNRDRPLVACNEDVVIANYGAIGLPNINRNAHTIELRHSFRRTITHRLPIRSRSMNLMFSRNANRADPSLVSTSSIALPRSANGGPPRSASIGGLSAAWRSSGYNSISEEPNDDRRPLIEPLRPIDEPPPPYEVALRMCAPLYERLRRSANSITSRLNSVSHSNSKELPHRRQLHPDGQSSSKDGE